MSESEFSDATLKQHLLTIVDRKEKRGMKQTEQFFFKNVLIRIQFLSSGQGKGLFLFSNASWQAANQATWKWLQHHWDLY